MRGIFYPYGGLELSARLMEKFVIYFFFYISDLIT